MGIPKNYENSKEFKNLGFEIWKNDEILKKNQNLYLGILDNYENFREFKT
jgi:hypothetical protein